MTQFGHSVVSNSLHLHGLQHARLPCHFSDKPYYLEENTHRLLSHRMPLFFFFFFKIEHGFSNTYLLLTLADLLCYEDLPIEDSESPCGHHHVTHFYLSSGSHLLDLSFLKVEQDACKCMLLCCR